MRCRSPIAALALLAAVALAPLVGEGQASAYCRSSVCEVDGKSVHGQVCAPPEDTDCGTVLQWRQPCVGFAVEQSGSRQVDRDVIEQTARASFAAWTTVDCGGGEHPRIEVQDLGVVTCGTVEYNQHAGNVNVIVFRDEVWPHGDEGFGTTDTIALTTVTYDVTKGDIFDADMEINSFQNQFTTDDTVVDVDLRSVMTHEAGHFLGLAHSSVADATMFPNYMNGSTELRAPKDDDQQAICNAYPPDRTPKGTCDGLPRHGFSPECSGAQTEGTCSYAPGSDAPSPATLLPLAALVVLASRRRRGSRNSKSEANTQARQQA